MMKKIIRYVLLAVILGGVFGTGIYLGNHQANAKICMPTNVDFSLFWDAYDKLHQNFIGREKIDDKKLMYGAIAGMTHSLGDPYTSFFDPDQATLFKQSLAGSFSGIGVEVGIKKELLTVISPLKGTPGEKAGLKAGDVFVKINGKSTTDMSVDDAVSIIRGKKGTPVTITMFREGWKDTKDFVIIRDTIKIDSLTWELKNGNVAYIHILEFNETLPQDFKKMALEILASPAKKIVLDLRNDPGGYLQVCQEIAGWFMEKGQVVTIEDAGPSKEKQIYKTEGNATFAQYPIVVLMNKGSASAAEILAGALRDNRNVQLIGEKSFGKGSVQEVDSLQDGKSFLKITIAKWLTPKGTSISEVGLTPDVAVKSGDNDTLGGTDAQLDKALEIIGTLK